ncbi:MAG: permease [Chloroflexota bacterium]|nr:permease [Chloroflexota bacterium]
MANNEEGKGRRSGMLVPTIIMGALALILLLVGLYRGQGQHVAGMKSALDMTIDTMPLLICSFIVAGMAQVLIPPEIISEWVGTESGIRGILIGAVTGSLAPGGPYVSLPIAAGLLRAGAGVGTMVAFLTGWSLWAVTRLPMEVGIMGWRFTLVRVASTFFFPPIAGLIAHALFANVR